MSENPTSGVARIGRLLGQVAVVGSLVYVGYEIRLNTRVAQSQSHQELVGLIMSIGDPLINEIEDVTELRARGDSVLTRLSDADRARFQALSNRSMVFYELAYYQWQEGLLDDDLWVAMQASLEGQFDRPGFVAYWDDDRAVFGSEFVDFVDTLL